MKITTLDRTIYDLPIDTRTRGTLRDQGIFCVGQILQSDISDLKYVNGGRAKVIRTIISDMKKRGDLSKDLIESNNFICWNNEVILELVRARFHDIRKHFNSEDYKFWLNKVILEADIDARRT